MSSPRDARSDNIVDATVLAGAGGEIERTYGLAELPRLSEAGALADTLVRATLKFSEFDDKPVIAGHVSGQLKLTCQRCMGECTQDLDETFRVLIVKEERADEPGGYEPIIADSVRLDLRWLVEDQTLLAMPLVAMHAIEECEQSGSAELQTTRASAKAQDGSKQDGQKPFENLRDMMRKR
jgi:uncharacterized protein